MKVSILIPVYNEEKTVSQIIDKVINAKLPKGFTRQIIIVNDGSNDKTDQIISKYKLKVHYIKHSRNQGKGRAIQTGLFAANGDITLIQDADLEYDPIYYPQLLQPFIDSRVNAVYGSRLINYPLRLWGKNKTPLPFHWLANHSLTILTNILFGKSVSDMETGYKAIRTDVLKSLNLSANRFNIEPEITAKLLKNKIKIIEIPITVKLRDYSSGKKIKWHDGISAVATLLRHRFFG